jgi:hypothetical protein
MSVAFESVAFDRWIAGRTVTQLGSNSGARPLPFQSWRHFKEAFSPELVARAVRSMERPVTRCVDPRTGVTKRAPTRDHRNTGLWNRYELQRRLGGAAFEGEHLVRNGAGVFCRQFTIDSRAISDLAYPLHVHNHEGRA